MLTVIPMWYDPIDDICSREWVLDGQQQLVPFHKLLVPKRWLVQEHRPLFRCYHGHVTSSYFVDSVHLGTLVRVCAACATDDIVPTHPEDAPGALKDFDVDAFYAFHQPVFKKTKAVSAVKLPETLRIRVDAVADNGTVWCPNQSWDQLSLRLMNKFITPRIITLFSDGFTDLAA